MGWDGMGWVYICGKEEKDIVGGKQWENFGSGGG
jgi:hypothetical protein